MVAMAVAKAKSTVTHNAMSNAFTFHAVLTIKIGTHYSDRLGLAALAAVCMVLPVFQLQFILTFLDV
jgi:hypothetical protein